MTNKGMAEAFLILAKYEESTSIHVSLDPDKIWIDLDPSCFLKEDVTRLRALGWTTDMYCFSVEVP